ELVTNSLTTYQKATPLDAEEIADDIVRHIRNACGTIVEKSPGLLGFSHRSLQEYYAALYLVRSESNITDHIQRWKYDNSYLELIRFYLGLTSLHYPGRAEQIVSMLLEQDSLLGSPLHKGLLCVLNCLSEIANPTEGLATRVSKAVSAVLFDFK